MIKPQPTVNSEKIPRQQLMTLDFYTAAIVNGTVDLNILDQALAHQMQLTEADDYNEMMVLAHKINPKFGWEALVKNQLPKALAATSNTDELDAEAQASSNALARLHLLFKPTKKTEPEKQPLASHEHQ